MARSLRETTPAYPLVVMTSPALSEASRAVLRSSGLEVLPLSGRFAIPAATLKKMDVLRWAGTFDKLEAFSLIQYDKVVFLDADMLINRNIDHLFEREHMSAAVGYGGVKPFEHFNFPNSGLMVIEPRAGLGEQIFVAWPEVVIKLPTFSDQDLIHTFYRDRFLQRYGSWRLSVSYNACAFVLDGIARKHNLNVRLDQPNQDTVAVVHFTSPNKPWRMSRKFMLYLFARKLVIGKWREIKVYRRYFSLLNTVRRNTPAV